jgi:hypothetical protein
MPDSIIYSGRRFSSQDLALMRQAAADYAALGITEIARTVCEWLDWKRPNGRLKNHECRLLLERLSEQGVLTLPPVRALGGRGRRNVNLTGLSDDQPAIRTTVGDLRPLQFRVVEKSESQLFRQWIERYHYLGYRTPFGANLRYFVQSNDGRMLACLQWSSPAWTMAPRDRWIGWTSTQRTSNLQYIVNNSRFLVLPWVSVKGLASTILARAANQLRQDWRQRYGYVPLLLETLVDTSRFKGTCYRAANWKDLGETTGRGRMDRHHEAYGKSIKRIFVFPLHPCARQLLCESIRPASVVPID